MSAQIPEAPKSNSGLLIGLGAGCGCLSLLVAGVVVLILFGVIFHAAGTGPAAQPPPQGGGAPAASGGLQITVQMAKLDQNHQPVQQTNAFQVGDVVGAVATAVAVPANVKVEAIWLKMDGDNATPLGDPDTISLGPDAVGQSKVFYVTGAPAGTYVFVIAQPGEGSELHPVAGQKFVIQ